MNFWIDFLIYSMIPMCVIQSYLVFTLVLKFFSSKSEFVEDSELPKAVVLMGLRGADPFLGESLKKMMQQDYPNYELHVVVDTKSDPAWDVVEKAIEETGSKHVRVTEFRDVPEHGPINSGTAKVVQAMRELDDSYEMIAMSDGDSNVHPTWLRELVSPMIRDENLAVTFGLHWYIPPDGAIGTIARHIFNAGAVVMMGVTPIPWQGCYCVRASVVRKLNLIDEWCKCVVLDCKTPGLLKGTGYRIAFVPTAMLSNNETCKLPYLFNWGHRQLLWARLYHKDWPLLLLHVIMLSIPPVLLILLASVATALGDVGSMWKGWAAVVAYWFFLTAVPLIVAWPVNRVLRKRGVSTKWLSPANLLRLFIGLPIAQFIYTSAAARATFQKRVVWRGITFEVDGPGQFRVLQNLEYKKTSNAVKSTESL